MTHRFRSDNPSVLIIGAGIAGLALGRALHERGLNVEIVERASAWAPAGAGIYLPGNGVRALAALGLNDLAVAKAVRMSQQRILNSRGRLLAQIDLDPLWGAVGPCVGLRRADLHSVLVDGASRVSIRLGTKVNGLTDLGDRVAVVFDDDVTREYDIVVGADGIHSTVRRLVFGATPPRYVGQVSWRFLSENAYRITNWTAMLAPGRAFLMMPVGGGGLYCYADLTTDRTGDHAGRDLVQFRALFADFAAPVPALVDGLDRADAVHFAPIEEVAVDPCAKGRVVLIGDAAHATSPNMAEGASMALEDAIVLSEILASGGNAVDLLVVFSERRRERVQWVQQRTHRRDRIRSLPAVLRDAALRWAGAHLYRRDYRRLLGHP